MKFTNAELTARMISDQKNGWPFCPRCGKPVYVGKKNCACSDRACQFVMWKNNRF